MIKAILVTEKEIKVIDFEPELENYYKLLECDLMDCTYRKIGTKDYAIFCDDEGLFKEDPRPSLFVNGQPNMVGNLIIVSADTTDDGEEIGLTDADVKRIMAHATTYSAVDKETGEVTKCDVPCIIARYC